MAGGGKEEGRREGGRGGGGGGRKVGEGARGGREKGGHALFYLLKLILIEMFFPLVGVGTRHVYTP